MNFRELMNFREFDWEDIKKDPDKRAKLMIYISIAMILSTVTIVIGTIFFILRILRII
jgi:hypothetical protein